MKKFMLVLVMLVCFMSGCNGAITPDDMKALAGKVDSLASQVDVYQKAAADIAEQVKITGIITPEQQAKVTELQAKIDVIQPQVTAISTAIKNAEYDPAGDSLKTILTAVRAANAASAPVNPYAGVIEAVLALAALVTGLFAVKKTVDAKASDETAQIAAEEAEIAQAKYQAHKQGTELTMKQLSASTVPEVKAMETVLYKNIGDARAAIL
jgi:hypothetical protein